MVGDIDFSKTVFLMSISDLLSAILSINITKKQDLLTHFGDATSDAMLNVIPFYAHYATPFAYPKRTYSCCSRINLPFFWPLPIHHTVTLLEDILLQLDAGTLQNSLNALRCVYFFSLTNNPLLNICLHAAC